jgi:transposase-like protein
MSPKCLCSPKSLVASGARSNYIRAGYFTRKSDGKKIQRYLTKCCRKFFSDASFSECLNQKKRHLNSTIFEHLVSGLSERKTAQLVRVNRKTIIRTMRLLGAKALELLPLINAELPKEKEVFFDDLITFEHTKCKPLSLILMVTKKRRILGFRLAQMTANGKLATLSRKKYGKRDDHRKKARAELFAEVKDYLDEYAVISSDQNPHYAPDVKLYFPKAKHKTSKGRRGCIVGQGELKRGGFDPLFSLNHTCAMMRDNIKRLSRKTWCTTKKAKYLGYKIAMYSLYHNLVLIQKRKAS